MPLDLRAWRFKVEEKLPILRCFPSMTSPEVAGGRTGSNWRVVMCRILDCQRRGGGGAGWGRGGASCTGEPLNDALSRRKEWNKELGVLLTSVQFPFGVTEMFWSWIVVMDAQHCNYTKNH